MSLYLSYHFQFVNLLRFTRAGKQYLSDRTATIFNLLFLAKNLMNISNFFVFLFVLVFIIKVIQGNAFNFCFVFFPNSNLFYSITNYIYIVQLFFFSLNLLKSLFSIQRMKYDYDLWLNTTQIKQYRCFDN